MIIYKKLKPHKKSKQKNVVFSIFENGVVSNQDESIVEANACKDFYNLSIKDGALKTGLGFRDIRVPASKTDLQNCHTFNFASKINEIDGLWLDRWYNNDVNEFFYQIYMIDSASTVWSIPLIDAYNGYVWKSSQRLQSLPTYVCEYRINNKDCVVFFSNEGMLHLGYSAEGLYENVPAMISCVVHYDKFFGITNSNRNTLVYTTKLNLQEWSDEDCAAVEFLDERGAFTKLVAFNDYVYLFREKGITKVSTYTTKSEFSFTHLYTSSSKIYEKSVCVCGDKVYFFTRDGLYTFNGSSVGKIMENCDKYFKNFDNSNCCSACLNGKYYFATKCNFDDGEIVGCESGEYTNNVLFEIDVESKQYEIFRGVDIRSLLAVDCPFTSKLCACFYNQYKQQIGELVFDGNLFETSTKKMWKSFKTDLGEQGKRKHIKEIVLRSSYPCLLEIISDEETKSFAIDGLATEQRLKASVYGKNFQFVFKTDAQNCDIKKPKIIFDVE